ncbi:hypothetical protein DXG03_000187 [Asterophora parasitica]|uniref:MutL C-terminal dimerisation domain-containing protein n=1 Tax=Asterophora parasitica TaxID=117018 RepID=A0A9P7KFS0_9AGAR|nr:hypothetical protein DXG03_000187 [Asterophora parasitica]
MTTKSGVPHWLQKALQANRTFNIAEVSVPRLHSSSSCFLQDSVPRHSLADPCDTHPARSQQAPRADVLGVTPDLNQHRFEKQDLGRAKVINQVDRKFIACLIEDHYDAQDSSSLYPPRDGPALVLIDQHAADERVRVERFLKDLCIGYLANREDTQGTGVRLRELSPSRPVLLTLHEAQRLKESRAIQESFRQWGFGFELSHQEHANPDDSSEEGFGAEDDTGYTQVWVKSIPEVVSDKLLIGDELRDLVKGFMGQLATQTLPMSQAAASAKEDENRDEFCWLKALRWCPRELLELINSKACRGTY